jgi:hypothetical protein
LFRELKKAWDAADLKQKFPGGYVAGERIKNPGALPALMPWPTGEAAGTKTNKGQVNDVEFEVAILGSTLDQCGDPELTKALETATHGMTANGPISLGHGARLVAVMPIPGARYSEFPPDLFLCFITFTAKLSY